MTSNFLYCGDTSQHFLEVVKMQQLRNHIVWEFELRTATTSPPPIKTFGNSSSPFGFLAPLSRRSQRDWWLLVDRQWHRINEWVWVQHSCVCVCVCFAFVFGQERIERGVWTRHWTVFVLIFIYVGVCLHLCFGWENRKMRHCCLCVCVWIE